MFLGFFLRNISEGWMEGFEEELTEWLTQAGAQQLSVTVAKNMLLQNIRQMVYYILSEYHFTDKFR